MAATREDLDKLMCGAPGCSHDGHGSLYLHAVCHPAVPPWACYADGELTVECSVCGELVVVVAVAGRTDDRPQP
jgi:hypothetical protein